MSPRTSTSIVLLAVLLAGSISPIGVCALMCERHSRATVAQHDCHQDSEPMSGMAHSHSAMHHSLIGAMTLLVQAQSCQTDCAVVEQLNISRKVVPQVTVVRIRAVVLDAATSKFSAPSLESAWSLDSGPPSFPSAYTASYSVLRI